MRVVPIAPSLLLRGAARALPVAAALSLLSAPAAAELDISAEVGGELRWFPREPLYPGQFSGAQPSVFGALEVVHEREDLGLTALARPYVRLDGRDPRRTHLDLREGYLRKVSGNLEVLAGAHQVFWGVTESRHLVNIVNQIDAVENIDEEDFLGQPMLQVGYQSDIGRIDAFLMTGFRERTFPGTAGRLRTSPAVDTDDALFESGAEHWRPELALRYSHYVGDVDIGLHLFHGNAREPDLLLRADGLRLVPRYPVITQAGIDLQYTTDAWLWKFEGLWRSGQGRRFFAAVAGFEYTLFQVLETDVDLGLLAEVLYDGRRALASLDPGLRSRGFRAALVFPTLFDRDLFLGTRLALNDVQDTALLAGVFIDEEDGPASVRVEFERRLGDAWRAEVEGNAFIEHNRRAVAAGFRRDGFVTLRLTRFF